MNSPVACCFGLSPELSFSLPSSARRLCLKGCLTPPSTALSGLSPPQCAVPPLGHRSHRSRFWLGLSSLLPLSPLPDRCFLSGSGP